jgi:glycosyltransferase involved in cell wall biosynthesis
LIKVLHILDSLNRGGAEIMALDLCRNAGANGLDLTFVATGGGDLEEDFRNSGVSFVRLQRRLPVDLSLASQLREIITSQKINIVHSHQPVEALHLYLATRSTDVKRVLTLHGFYPGTKNELALRFVLPRIHECIVVSNEVMRLLNEKSRVKLPNATVIDNGVDAKRLKTEGKNLRDEFGLVAEQVLFGMIGNFSPVAQKDQMTVCRALPAIFQAIPNAHFVFIGGRSEAAPQLFDECLKFCEEAGISQRVHFAGKRSDIGSVLSSLNLFVLSSLREGAPISVIEAMLAGVPTLLSDIAPLREISENGKYAVLFKASAYDDLAEKLIALFNDPGKREKLKQSGREWANSRFSIETHINNLVEIYGRLVA